MNKSETITALATAMAEAQGEMENASKNSTNPHFKSKYADLAEILNTARPVMARHGLSVVQFPSLDGNIARVETVLMHKSGEWMSEVCGSPMQKADPQGVGSALTYLRRYSLAAVCGLAQEDDDAQAAVKPKAKATVVQPEQPKTQPEPLLTDAQRKQLMAIYKDAPREVRIDDANELFQHAKPGCKRIESFSELTQRQAAWLIAQLAPKEAANA